MKIDKKTKKEIRSIIKGLPSMLHDDKTQSKTVYGQTLIDQGAEKTKTGVALDPKKRYLVDGKMEVNHQTEAEKVFVKEGFNGVRTYVDTVNGIYDKAVEDFKNKSAEISE